MLIHGGIHQLGRSFAVPRLARIMTAIALLQTPAAAEAVPAWESVE